jgi:presenilin-like A22 family membrane protease
MKHLKSVAAIALTFIAVQILAMVFMYYALSPADQVFQNPDDPMIAVYYLVLLLAFTGLFLVLVKFGFASIMKAVFFVSIGFVVFFVAGALCAILTEDAAIVTATGICFALISIVSLWKHPEWYVIDSVGLVMSIGMVALLGISLSVIPILLLLIALAVYDFLSVYKTKHMLTLADGVSEMGLPLLLVIPKKLPYSYMESKPKIKVPQDEEKPEREAFLIGLGDIIIPGLLSASAFWFITSPKMFLGIPSYLAVALGTVAGAVVGLVFLMRIVIKGNPQAGLPLLNTGAVLGFFVTYILVFGLDFSFIS